MLGYGINFGGYPINPYMSDDALLAGQSGSSSIYGYGFVIDPMTFMQQYMTGGMNVGNYLGNFIMNMGNCFTNCGTGIMSNLYSNWSGPCFSCGGGNSASKTSQSAQKDPDQLKYNNMKSLLDKYVNWYENTMKYGTCDLKTEMSDINKSKDSYQDKYSKLMNLYSSISADKKTAFLQSSTAASVSVGSSKMSALLDVAGCSVNNTAKSSAEGLVTNAASADTKVSDALNNVSVVNLISNYNTSSKNLIEDICSKGLNNNNVKAKAQALKDALVKEAKEQCKNLETDNKYYETLEKMNISDSNKTTFINEFNKVYAYTRVIASKTADNMLNEAYGMANSVITLAEKDLKEEKFISTYVAGAKALKVKSDAIIGERTFNSVNNLSDMEKSGDAEKALETLASSSSGQLKKLSNKVKIDNVEYTVYQEMYGDNKLNYIAKDGKIYTATLNPPKLCNEITNWQEKIQEKMVDAHRKEQDKIQQQQIEEEQQSKKTEDAARQLAQDKRNLTSKLSLSVANDPNATIKLKTAGALIANVVYMSDKPQITKCGSDSSFTKQITLSNGDRIMVRKSGDNTEVYVTTGGKDVIYKFNANGAATVDYCGKDIKISYDGFKDNLFNALTKIFGDDIV